MRKHCGCGGAYGEADVYGALHCTRCREVYWPTEGEIQQEVLLTLGQLPDLTVWRNNTGALKDETGRLVRFGCPGSPDIMGIVQVPVARVGVTDFGEQYVIGRFFGLEVKDHKGRQASDQSAFEKMVRRRGGFYRLVKTVKDAVEAYHAARRGDA